MHTQEDGSIFYADKADRNDAAITRVLREYFPNNRMSIPPQMIIVTGRKP